MLVSRRSCRTGAAALVALVALAASAASANAGVLVASAPSCADQALAKTFLPWLDLADYTALSDGDFETGARGWSTTDGASVASGNEPWRVGGSNDSKSLSLPAGAAATSPAICVGITHPTIRFFAKRRTGGMLSSASLRVDVLFETADGDVVSLPIGAATNGGSWQPTAAMVVVANLLPLLPGEMTPVSFRFTAEGADFSIDDVWVDPYSRR